MSAPRVSVLVPCHDLGRYLDEAVASVLAQSFQDLEILVVDDGSTDEETVRLLAEYRRPKTTLIRSPHQGLARARNLALSRARGEYVCALDADDRLDPDFLAATIGALDADPDLTFCSCWLRTFGEEEWEWRRDRCDLPTLLAECTVITAAPVRRAAVLAAGGWDAAMPAPGYEDWDLWITLVERGHRGTILPRPLFYYRRRSGSMSETCNVGETHLRLWSYLLAKHRDSYRRHRFDLLARREAEAAELLRGNYRHEQRLAGHLAPQIAALRDELERLRRRGDAAAAGSPEAPPPLAAARLAELERELAAARFEVAALRSSWSWRITAPLRALYGTLYGRWRGEPR